MTWPKNFRVCQQCGAQDDGLLRRCGWGGSTEHSYKRVPLVPASIAEELAAAIERATTILFRDYEIATSEQGTSVLGELSAVLQSYHAALGDQQQSPAPEIVVRLPRHLAEHLFLRCTESTNAPKINGYSCEDCRVIGDALRAALGEETE